MVKLKNSMSHYAIDSLKLWRFFKSAGGGECTSRDFEGTIIMKKLLVIGAGGHGKVVAEIAQALGYEMVSFLDDNRAEAIGKTSEVEKFKNEYQEVFVGIGNNKIRAEWFHKLQECGYTLPVLIHPTAYVSKTAVIGMGTVVEPKAIVNANSRIAEGCIISVGSIVDHDVNIDSYCHINAGAIVKAGASVEKYRKLEAGEVMLGYEAARVKS